MKISIKDAEQYRSAAHALKVAAAARHDIARNLRPAIRAWAVRLHAECIEAARMHRVVEARMRADFRSHRAHENENHLADSRFRCVRCGTLD